MKRQKTICFVGIEKGLGRSLKSTFEKLGFTVRRAETARQLCLERRIESDMIVAGPGLSQEQEYDLVKTIRLSGNKAPIMTFTTRVKPANRDLGWRIALDSACIAAVDLIFGGGGLAPFKSSVGFNLFSCSQGSLERSTGYWRRKVVG